MTCRRRDPSAGLHPGARCLACLPSADCTAYFGRSADANTDARAHFSDACACPDGPGGDDADDADARPCPIDFPTLAGPVAALEGEAEACRVVLEDLRAEAGAHLTAVGRWAHAPGRDGGFVRRVDLPAAACDTADGREAVLEQLSDPALCARVRFELATRP